MERRISSFILSLSVIAGGMVFPNTQAFADSQFTETLFNAGVVSSLKIQPMDFLNEGDFKQGKSIGGFFTASDEGHVTHKNEDSVNVGEFIGGEYSYYCSSDKQENDKWYYKTTWTPSTEQKEVLNALLTDDNNMYLTASFQSWRDTQAGHTAGLAYMNIGDSNGSKIETMTDDDSATCKWNDLAVGNMKMESANYYSANIGSTKGNTFGKNRNYAAIKSPAVYIVDTVAPKVKSVTVENNADGNKNFVAGDEIKIDVKFTEPIRTNDYNAFKLSLFSGNDFTPVSYDDSTCTLVMKAVVEDIESQQISKGNFKLTISISKDKITDIAGNSFGTSTYSFSDGDVVISGLVPRISKMSYDHAEIKNGDSYETINALTGGIKPGDRLYFDMLFNQDMQYFGDTSKEITYNMIVGESIVPAKLVSASKNNSIVSSGAVLPKDKQFQSLRFCLEIPENTSDNVEIYAAASNDSSGFWAISDAGTLSDVRGNLILTISEKRQSPNAVTTIKAEGKRLLPIIYTDSSAPKISLTNTDGTAAAVYDNAANADTSGKKTNEYTVCFKSDEEVSGSVSAKLVCASKTSAEDVIETNTVSMGAYTSDTPTSGMEVTFTVPEGCDSHEYDIYIETTAQDILHNTRTQKFYLAADTKAPSITIAKSAQENESERWYDFTFNVDDASSADDRTARYKFGSDSEFSYTDEESGFTIQSVRVALNEQFADTVEYYAEDGSGNRSESALEIYSFSDDTAPCTVTDSSYVSKYLPPRDITFTGFEPTDGTFMDYFAYKINDGKYTYIKNEYGEDMTIPASELTESGVILYKRIRTANAYADDNTPGALGAVMYCCDNSNPDMSIGVSEDEFGNVLKISVTAPIEHPKNIVKCEMSLNDSEYVDVTDRFVANGVVTAIISMDKVPELYNLPSGRYTMKIRLTDLNGHATEETVFEDKDIITDELEIAGAKIISGESQNPFSAGEPIYAESAENAAEVIMTAESAANAHALSPSLKAESYIAVINAMFRYEGSEYSSSNISYSISEDGENWTEYTSEGLIIENGNSSVKVTDGEKYAVYTVALPLPKAQTDGTHSYYIKLKSEANPNTSDTLKISTLTDTTAPSILVAETAVGNDEEGWSDTVEYTDKYVKLSVDAIEDGFCGNAVTTVITSVLDADGNTVSAENIANYAEITNGDTAEASVILKNSCTVTFKSSDIWGNSAEVSHICELIDTSELNKSVKTSSDGIVTYAVIGNVKSYSMYAVPVGTETISDEAMALYNELKNNGIINVSGNAVLSGKSNSAMDLVLNIKQLKPSEPYDIICLAENGYGTKKIFKVMTLDTGNTPIEAKPFTSSVTNRGGTIHAVQKLEFSVPVVQLGTDVAEEFNAGSEIDSSDIDTYNAVYSTTVYALLDYRSGGTVYVMDRFGNIQKIDVDTTGTEFVDYNGYSVAYEDVRESEVLGGDSNYIYGSNSNIRITVDGNSGISLIKPVSDSVKITGSNPQFISSDEYYGTAVIEANISDLEGEGTAYIADMKVYNVNGETEYNDAVVVRYDNTPPELVGIDSAYRGSTGAVQRVLYTFYDRHGIEKIEEDVGDGYSKRASQKGMYLAQYIESCTPKLKVTDNFGNVFETDGTTVNIDTEAKLYEGVDYVISATDADGKEVESGKYYTSVNACVKSVSGGKAFTADPSGTVSITSEMPVIFRLYDSSGASKLISYTLPIDITPPTIRITQDNAGTLVHKINYSISVSDEKSGIAHVYVAGAGTDGSDLELTETDGTYKFTAYDDNDYTIRAVDALGNIAEQTASSNSSTVGDLEIYTSYSTLTATKDNVTAVLSAADGRRIYTKLDKILTSDLTLKDYVIFGNTVTFRKNGAIQVVCSDELGDTKEVQIAVTNMDTTLPTVKCTVSPVYDDLGELDPGAARITFKAEGSDADAVGAVRLVRFKNDSGYTSEEIMKIWEDYSKNPDAYIDNIDFDELCEKLFYSDIALDTTYVDVTENGNYTFVFLDEVNNIGSAEVKVDIIDAKAPTVTNVGWSFKYSESPNFKTFKTAQGTLEVKNGTAELTEENTGHLTNESVTVTVTADEDVRIFGDTDAEFSNTVTKTFRTSGTYQLILEDKAGNTTTFVLAVNNIVKDELYIELEDTSDIIIYEGTTGSLADYGLKDFKVYKYNDAKTKVYLEPSVSNVDLGDLNIDNVENNTFDRTSPYIITYTAWDSAGNKAELTRRVILCGKNDIVLTVDGKLPDNSNCVFIDKKSAELVLENYTGAASVRIAKGQYNGAQMKTRGTVLSKTNGSYHFDFSESGWYTVLARTLYQDMYVVRIYVSADSE